ncbi:DNA/RNA-binding domain E.t1.c1-type [Penicillium subrubescens]|uniref:DNA/RNA-binding domain E.t1.c1-type n=1 Tax=Penicillium subrubescens TaxID=1316194 RepID=UPI002544D853|nr:DNA/RNA-binding domain E.t1.c1-type [Penicillium subrubescens]KAJ5904750.1 DNA/RNA-binding domain E.t1.c1-type [Penicillium subrubescens]
MDAQDIEIDKPLTPHISEDEDGGCVSDSDIYSAEPQYLESTTLFKQPETKPVLGDGLILEVNRIFASLTKIEAKCIELVNKYIGSDPSNKQWQEMISLHRTLVYKHVDLYLASQHPSADNELKELPKSNDLPARLWFHGIHSLLELLRKQLPGSQEYMLAFFYLVYTMMTQLLERVEKYCEIWIECLGDLARYRMAIEESDKRVRDVWAGVSRHWYNVVADRSPEEGRIQHHLAVLARPGLLQQLFHHTKALVSVRPFAKSRESMIRLLSPYNAQDALDQDTIPAAFIATHAALLNETPSDQFITLANHFLSLLREELRSEGYDGQTGVYIMSCNFASLLQYGDPKAIMAIKFGKKEKNRTKKDGEPTDLSVHLPPMMARGSALTFHTLSVLLDNHNPKTYAGAHISMSFVWSLAAHPATMQQVYKVIPWAKIVRFLNSLVGPETKFGKVEDRAFPLHDGVACQLPEDFIIRGQSWSQHYFPSNFFNDAPPEAERYGIEQRSITILRRHRCLWLGVQIATVGDWIAYNNRKFEITKYASNYALIAESFGGLNSKSLESSFVRA